MKDTQSAEFTVTVLLLCASVLLIGYSINSGMVADSATDGHFTEPTMDVIRAAAERNGIEYGSEDWYILLAIWKAENGSEGREFGVMNPKAHDLDTQAGWCAASIVKSRQRWIDAGKPEDFITFMGQRYCPPDDHPLNKNWVSNVKYWKNKLNRRASP